MTRLPCVGYICPGIAGADRERDSAAIHHAAAKLGYVIAAIVFDMPGRYAPFGRIMTAAWCADAAAVIVPSNRHLPAGEAADLLAIGEVIVIESAERYTTTDREVQVTDLWTGEPRSGAASIRIRD